MCVEEYAASVAQGSRTLYSKLYQEGIIDELKDDYEDMHGMSSYSINEYIGKRTAGPIAMTPDNVHVSAKIILISQTIELIANKYKLTIEETRNRFYASSVIEMLDDDETGLYGSSALHLLSLYENNLKDDHQTPK